MRQHLLFSQQKNLRLKFWTILIDFVFVGFLIFFLSSELSAHVNVDSGNGKKEIFSNKFSKTELSEEVITPFYCDIVSSDVACNEVNSGMASAAVVGGELPYTFLWSHGATTQNVSGLEVGLYELTVTDNAANATSCLVDIGGFSCDINQISCGPNSLGIGTATTVDGAPPFHYLWNTGETTNSISNLIPGDYNVIITDSNDCEVECNTTIDRCADCDIKCETAFARKIGAAQCFQNFGFDRWGWTNGLLVEGMHTFELYSLEDDCDLADGELVGELTMEYAGDTVIIIYEMFDDFSLLVTSLYVGCELFYSAGPLLTVSPSAYPYQHVVGGLVRDTFVIDVGSFPCEGVYVIGHAEVCEPNVLECQISSVGINCQGSAMLGSAEVSETGGRPPYTYLWSTGATTKTLDGLFPGSYSVQVTDVQECESECTVVVDRCQLCDMTCATSFARLEGAAHCFSDFGFSRWGWTNGLIMEGMHVFDLYAEALLCDFGSAEFIGELRVNYVGDSITVIYVMTGEYQMSYTNLFIGCEEIPIKNGVQTTDPSAYPYQHTLSQATSDTFIMSLSDLTCEGVYLIAHAEVCKSTVFRCDLETTPVNCMGSSIGAASATVIGGELPYNYQWSNGSTAAAINNLSSGIYSVTITDANNCVLTCDDFVSFPEIMSPQLGPYCQNDPPFDLSRIFADSALVGWWTGPGVVEEIVYPSALATGSYRVIYEDVDNCVSASINIQIDTSCCPLDYKESNNRLLIGIQLDSIHYETNGVLESVQVIDANTTYDSQNEILLKEQFEVRLGNTFEAIIDGCP